MAEAVARKRGESEPKGYYGDAGRWYPSDEERRECCSEVQQPEDGWSWSLKKHATTSRHVAHLYDVPEGLLMQRVRLQLAALNREAKRQRRPAVEFASDQRRPAHELPVVIFEAERQISRLRSQLTDIERGLRDGKTDLFTPTVPVAQELDYWMQQMHGALLRR